MRIFNSMIWLSLAFTLFAGCEKKDPCDQTTEDGVPVELWVGTGEKEFSSLEDGTQLPMSFGSQGGIHVFIALESTGLLPGQAGSPFSEKIEEPDVRILLTYNGEEVGDFWRPGLEIGDGGRPDNMKWEGDLDSARIHGMYLYLNYFADYAEVGGEYVPLESPLPVTLTVTVTDSCGAEIQVEKDVFL
jgi:hypothetical protein